MHHVAPSYLPIKASPAVGSSYSVPVKNSTRTQLESKTRRGASTATPLHPPSAIHVSKTTYNQPLSGIRKQAPAVLCSLPPLGMRSASADWARCISYRRAILSEDFSFCVVQGQSEPMTMQSAALDLPIQTHTSACVATKAIRKCRPRNGALLQVHSHP